MRDAEAGRTEDKGGLTPGYFAHVVKIYPFKSYGYVTLRFKPRHGARRRTRRCRAMLEDAECPNDRGDPIAEVVGEDRRHDTLRLLQPIRVEHAQHEWVALLDQCIHGTRDPEA